MRVRRKRPAPDTELVKDFDRGSPFTQLCQIDALNRKGASIPARFSGNDFRKFNGHNNFSFGEAV
jgi:hypothetical protein